MPEPSKCKLCGEPMPPGEEMFKLHGYSGPCPKPPLPRTDTAARWYDDVHTPTEPGLYYSETCDQFGNPRPGLFLWEEGKPPQFPTADPFKMFGPIPNAMKPWPMVPLART